MVDEWADSSWAVYGFTSGGSRIIELHEQHQQLSMEVDHLRRRIADTAPLGRDGRVEDLRGQCASTEARMLQIDQQADDLLAELTTQVEGHLRNKRLIARGFAVPFTSSSPRLVVPYEHWSVLRLKPGGDTAEGAGVKYLSLEIDQVSSWRRWCSMLGGRIRRRLRLLLGRARRSAGNRRLEPS